MVNLSNKLAETLFPTSCTYIPGTKLNDGKNSSVALLLSDSWKFPRFDSGDLLQAGKWCIRELDYRHCMSKALSQLVVGAVFPGHYA